MHFSEGFPLSRSFVHSRENHLFFLSFTFGFCNTSDLTSKVEPNGFLISDFPLEIANLSVSWQLCFHRFHKVFSQLKLHENRQKFRMNGFCHKRQLTIFSIKWQNWLAIELLSYACNCTKIHGFFVLLYLKVCREGKAGNLLSTSWKCIL